MSQPPFEAVHVQKSFQQGTTQVVALRDVSLIGVEAEFLAIMGASGSGKSTLLHALAGLTNIDDGVVRVEGNDLGEMSDARLTRFRRERIGVVFQAFNLIPTLNAEDNVRLPMLGMEGLGDQVGALFESLGISNRRDHRPDALSGGEQQRVAIARALVSDPALLLLDEPTGSLDSVAGQALCQILRDLSTQQGRTVVVVTHEPAVACWADRVVVLRDGLLIDEYSTAGIDDAETLARRYQASLQVPVVEGRSGT
ncbi:MAG: ABC transporter ATP-binding protein [Planctomycetota bacterium]